jgi:hypothetical protein
LICSFDNVGGAGLMSTVAFTEYGTTKLAEAVGFALDGVLLMNGINNKYVDIFYPVSWNSTGPNGEVIEYIYEDETDLN